MKQKFTIISFWYSAIYFNIRICSEENVQYLTAKNNNNNNNLVNQKSENREKKSARNNKVLWEPIIYKGLKE